MNNILSEIHRALLYEPESGHLRWKVDSGTRAKKGQIAGTKSKDAPIYVRVAGRSLLAHRVAFVLMTGTFPKEHVDHIDGDVSNNKWSNLRACDRFQNMQNRKVSKNNKSGLLGVSPHKSRWRAMIYVNNKCIDLGLFVTPQQAHAAYAEAKRALHTFNPKVRAHQERQ